MKITLPTGYELPDGAKPGEPFEVVATLVASDDGTFDLVAVDGMEIEETPDTDVETPEEEMAPAIKLPWQEA